MRGPAPRSQRDVRFAATGRETGILRSQGLDMGVKEKHEERRTRIAQIVTQIITKRGLDDVTVRRVADLAGFSTTIVTHYFANKKDLLLYTYQWASDQSYGRVDESLRRDPTDLMGLMQALAWVDHPEYWKVNLAYFQMCLADRDFKREQQRRADDARRMIVELLQRRAQAGLPVAAHDAQQAARSLVLAIQGLGLQSVLHDKDWTDEEKVGFLRDQVRLVTG